MIQTHTTDLASAYVLDIFMPIGFTPVGDVLFSIEPAGRGGGWIYRGEYSNLYQTAIDSAEIEPLTPIFTCPARTPFCIGDFSHDFGRFAHADSQLQTLTIADTETAEVVWSTTVTDRTFLGRPIFARNGDVAFVAVDVVGDGNELRSENGYIGVIDFPYDGEVAVVSAENAADLVTWIDSDSLLYYELLSNSSGAWRYPVLNRSGIETGLWSSSGRFPTVVR